MEEEISPLNKVVIDKEDALTQVHEKLGNQETKLCHHQQQKERLQQQHDDGKKTHKLELTKVNKVLSSNTEEIFRLRNHNKTLITKIKKLKNSSKREHSGEDLEGKILEKQEENQFLNNRNQELHNQIKELEIEKMSQDERIEKIQNHNKLLENQEAQIQENAPKNQIEEVKAFLATVQNKEEQTTPTPYNILIIIIILTNDGIKTSTHRRIMLTGEKTNMLSNN